MLRKGISLSLCMQGPTWQQAVQWIEEVPIQPKQRVTVTAKHDTYGISFALRPAEADINAGESGPAAKGTGPCLNISKNTDGCNVPLWVCLHNCPI